MTTKPALLYARVSTDEQFATNQIDYATEWAPKHGYTIAAVYADEGVSGTVPFEERPAGKRLLDDLRANGATAVLAYKLDRIGRDPSDTLVAIKMIERAGAQFVSMTEPIDNSSAGRLMTTIIAGLGGFERDNILERSSTAMAQLARKPNYYPGGVVAYGYAVEGEGREACLVIDDRIIPKIDMSAADVIRLIYRWIADEGRSTYWVADELTRRGVPTRYTLDGRAVRRKATSGIWRPPRIGNLVRNSTYKGVAVYGRRHGGKSPFPVPETTREAPAIVTVETWERAQAALQRNLAFSPRNSRRQYLLRGLVKCGACGLNYTGLYYITASREERRYYKCNGRHQARGLYGANGQRCPNPTLAWHYEGQIWADIDAWLDDPGPILDDLAAQLNAEAGQDDDLGTEIQRLRHSLEGIEGQRQRLLTAYRKGIIEDAELESELATIRQEVTLTEGEIAALERAESRQVERRAQLVTAAELLEQLRDIRRDGLSFEIRRQVVEALVKEIVVDSEGVPNVVYRFTPIADHMDMDSLRTS